MREDHHPMIFRRSSDEKNLRKNESESRRWNDREIVEVKKISLNLYQTAVLRSEWWFFDIDFFVAMLIWLYIILFIRYLCD